MSEVLYVRQVNWTPDRVLGGKSEFVALSDAGFDRAAKMRGYVKVGETEEQWSMMVGHIARAEGYVKLDGIDVEGAKKELEDAQDALSRIEPHTIGGYYHGIVEDALGSMQRVLAAIGQYESEGKTGGDHIE